MAFHIYAHDQGCIDYVDSHETRRSAQAHVSRLLAEIKQHPSWFDAAAVWFEVSTEPPYRETYQFPDMSDH